MNEKVLAIFTRETKICSEKDCLYWHSIPTIDQSSGIGECLELFVMRIFFCSKQLPPKRLCIERQLLEEKQRAKAITQEAKR